MRKKEASRELDRHRSKLNLSLINVHGEGKKTEHTAGNVVKKKPKTVKRLGEREISTRERERESRALAGIRILIREGMLPSQPSTHSQPSNCFPSSSREWKTSKTAEYGNKVRGCGEYNINMEKISKKPNYKIKEKKKKKGKGKKKDTITRKHTYSCTCTNNNKHQRIG